MYQPSVPTRFHSYSVLSLPIILSNYMRYLRVRFYELVRSTDLSDALKPVFSPTHESAIDADLSKTLAALSLAASKGTAIDFNSEVSEISIGPTAYITL